MKMEANEVRELAEKSSDIGCAMNKINETVSEIKVVI